MHVPTSGKDQRVGIFGKNAAVDLAPELSAALDRSGDTNQNLVRARRKLSREQATLERIASGEEIDVIASGFDRGFLVVTDQRSLVMGDGDAVSTRHDVTYRAIALHRGVEGLVSVISEQENSQGLDEVEAIGTYLNLGPHHPIVRGQGLGIKFPVCSESVASVVRDFIQMRVSELQWPCPSLFPHYYCDVLTGLGKPVNEQNVLALVEYLSQMLAVDALMWFDKFDQEAGPEWWRRFDNKIFPPDRWVYLADDMIKFLWDRNWRFRRGLTEFVDGSYQKMLKPDSRLRRYPGELPFGIWGDR